MKRTLEAQPQITNDELVRKVEKAADVYARYYVQGTSQDPPPDRQEWILEAALGCFKSFYVLEALHTSSSATAQSVSRQHDVCIAYWPVW